VKGESDAGDQAGRSNFASLLPFHIKTSLQAQSASGKHDPTVKHLASPE
jgi:hypothetical protein